MKKALYLVLIATLAGCGSTASYNPNNARSVQDEVRNADIYLNCPTGAVVQCDVEGGALVGKTYSNCRCAR